MIISIKDSIKMFGISIMTCCAVTVCNLFLNYYIDLKAVDAQVVEAYARALYDAQVMTCKVICLVCGGCLAITTAVMLFFYIKHYIDTHSKELGLLKALGYSNFKIGKGFSAFGLSVLIGCALGYLLSFALMPRFYYLQNIDELIPDLGIGFHPLLFLLLVPVPAALFSLMAVGYSVIKLDRPCVDLMSGIVDTKTKNRDFREQKDFVGDMRKSVLKSRKSLVFFIGFASFCFSDMLEMSAGMKELASDMAAVMIFVIGLVLAFTTLFISVTTVMRSNQKNIAMMRVFGYDAYACKHAVLDGYRLPAYIGFAIGSAYQYGLLKIMVDIVFADVEGIPEIGFDIPVFFIVLAAFIVIYEGIMYLYGKTLRNIPLKLIMTE